MAFPFATSPLCSLASVSTSTSDYYSQTMLEIRQASSAYRHDLNISKPPTGNYFGRISNSTHRFQIRAGDYSHSLKLSKFGLGDYFLRKPAYCRHGFLLSSSSTSYFGRRRGDEARTSGARNSQLRYQTSYAYEAVVEPNIPCNSCKGRGWLVCDFCEGQKVNVQSKNNRIYRRCPSCRAAGVVICPQCKVFKCVSFPDEKDAGIAL